MNELILKMEKKNCSSTIKCKNEEHYKKILERFKKRGYKQVPYIEEIKFKPGLPF